MKHVYPIACSDEIVETHGRLFGRFQCENPDADGQDFIAAYMRGETCARIDVAAAVLSNMTATELSEEFVAHDGYVKRPGRAIDPFAVLAIHEERKRVCVARRAAAKVK